MNQQNVREDAQELRLRGRIMQLRDSVRTLDRERQRMIEDVRGAEPQDVEMLDGIREVMERGLELERGDLNNAERLHRATYPNLLERIDLQEEMNKLHEHLIKLEWTIARNERIRHLQQLGELPPNIPEVPLNPAPPIVRDNRFPRLLRQLLRPPNAEGPAGRLVPEGPAFDVRAPRLIPQLQEGPANAAPEAPVVEGLAPGVQRRAVGPERPREAQLEEDPEEWIEDVGVPHPRN
ncbi:unnamed protein product [Caenorhabditis nigoni]